MVIPQPTNLRRDLLTATAMVALAACAGAVTVTNHNNVAASYAPEELYVVATGDNELRTVIIGNPFDMPKVAFETAVLATMEGRNFGPRLNLSTDPKQEDARKRHVVLAFDLANRGNASSLCAGSANATKVQPTGAKLTVTGVYCAGNLPLTQATARAGQVTGINSERFRSLMTQLAIALFPTESRKRIGSGE